MQEWSHDDAKVMADYLARIASVKFHYGVKPWLNIPMAGRVGELVDYDEKSLLPYVLRFYDRPYEECNFGVTGQTFTFGYSADELDELYDKVYPY